MELDLNLPPPSPEGGNDKDGIDKQNPGQDVSTSTPTANAQEGDLGSGRKTGRLRKLVRVGALAARRKSSAIVDMEKSDTNQLETLDRNDSLVVSSSQEMERKLEEEAEQEARRRRTLEEEAEQEAKRRKLEEEEEKRKQEAERKLEEEKKNALVKLRKEKEAEKMSQLDKKNERLGKKRGRQTMLLDQTESLHIARPPKVPTSARSGPSAHRPLREVLESIEQPQQLDEPNVKVRKENEVKEKPEIRPEVRSEVRPEVRTERPQFQRPTVRRHSQNGGERRPNKQQRVAVSQSPDSSIERLHREATSYKLWQQAGESELQRVPGSFESVEEYVQVFEPLLFEECRAQIRSSWEELWDQGKNCLVYVKTVEKRDRGWWIINLLPVDPRGKFHFKEGEVAILSTSEAKEGSSEDGKEKGEAPVNIAGMVYRFMPLDSRDPPGASVHAYFGETEEENSFGGYPWHMFNLLGRSLRWTLTVVGGLATSQREYVALHGLYKLHPQMINAILQPRPELFPRYDQQQADMLSCFTAAFVEYLHKNFNPPQLSAIKWAAMHTAAGTTAAAREQESWPFSLVQGPPGTGKTHTVSGMLNAIHLVQYQRYYDALLKKIAPETTDAGDDEQSGWLDEDFQNMDRSLARILPKLCPKPRMLVCAPSNAATDELLARVLEKGFIDGELKGYRPDVARVGTDPQSKAAQAVSVEKRTEGLLGRPSQEITEWSKQLRAREYHLSQSIAQLQRDLNASRLQGAVGVEPEVLASRDQARHIKLQQLASLLEERDKVVVEIQRFKLVEEFQRHVIDLEFARGRLEASFANEAEIVFTTVSSSGRKLFTNLARRFDIVVIDEAAQASELGVLPPLILGASRCVLVGDPQQLPATVISRVADTMQYSRSLFERFQQGGCPTLMLTVQYRMHPQIRDFPSRHFYQGKLQDSDSVKNLADEIYHHDPLLQPYLFFDISHGRESHINGSVSYQNRLEARFAVKLFEHLQSVVKAAGNVTVTVGVISPYKLQLKCIQKEFESTSADAKNIYINTVDAFQGQERDVIIMSCVRASNHGVGFVADIRRMNVALTRARRSLWVIGNASTLSQSEDWAALIADAKSRNCFITYDGAVEKGLITDGVETGESSSRQEYYRTGSRDYRGGGGRSSHYRNRHDELQRSSDSYLRQHNSRGKC